MEHLTDADKYNRLEQRRNWLTERIIAKEKVGWDTVYDTSERDALTWALELIKKKILCQ